MSRTMKTLGYLLLLFVVAVFWAAGGYSIGYLSGQADLDAWMKDQNIMRFQTVHECPAGVPGINYRQRERSQ